MPPNVDPAILEALGLEATSSKLVAHGGSGFSSTFKLVAAKDGRDVTYFVKIGFGPEADVMFRGRPVATRSPEGISLGGTSRLTRAVPNMRTRLPQRDLRRRAGPALLPAGARPRRPAL